MPFFFLIILFPRCNPDFYDSLKSTKVFIIYMIKAHIFPQMGSLNGGSGFEFQEESLVSPATASRTAARKVASLDSSPNVSFATAGPEYCDSQCIWNSTLRSIKVVFFSNKINLLVPLGPLAILVHKLTNHHVSCNISTIPKKKLLDKLGIILVHHSVF